MYPLNHQGLIETERHKDALREAEKYRLIKMITSSKQSPSRLRYHRMLAHLGAWLVSVGSRLQSPYEEFAAAHREPQISTEPVTPCS